MSDHAVKKIDEMEAIYGGAFKRARAELGVESFGMQIIDMPANYDSYPEHDHEQDGQEEVYVDAPRRRRDRDRRRALPARPRPRRPGRPRRHPQGLAGGRGHPRARRSAARPARPTRRPTSRSWASPTRWRRAARAGGRQSLVPAGSYPGQPRTGTRG